MAAAARETADVNAGIAIVICHPHPITQHGAAGKWARRIDREYPDPLFLGSIFGNQAVDQGGLAGAGRAGDADSVGVTRARIDPLHHGADHGGTVLDEADKPRQREAVAGAETFEHRVESRVIHRLFSRMGGNTDALILATLMITAGVSGAQL